MLLLLIAGALLVTSCGASQGGQARPGSTGDAPPSPVEGSAEGSTPPLAPGVPTPTVSLPPPPQPGTTGGQADVPGALLDQVRADAAQRAGVAPADVRIVSSTAQTWGDGSLGCPQPGESYIQVTVDGFQIFAEAGGRTFDYRTSRTGVRLCQM